MALDLNRGVLVKFHPVNRMQVAMYIDRPGEYLTETGEAIDAKFAKEAGYDVAKDLRKKVANEKLAAYKAQLDAEMRAEEDALAQAMTDKSGHDVRHIGGGQYALFDKTGKRLTKVAMTKADIEMLVGTVVTDPNDPNAGSTEPAQVAS